MNIPPLSKDDFAKWLFLNQIDEDSYTELTTYNSPQEAWYKTKNVYALAMWAGLSKLNNLCGWSTDSMQFMKAFVNCVNHANTQSESKLVGNTLILFTNCVDFVKNDVDVQKFSKRMRLSQLEIATRSEVQTITSIDFNSAMNNAFQNITIFINNPQSDMGIDYFVSAIEFITKAMAIDRCESRILDIDQYYPVVEAELANVIREALKPDFEAWLKISEESTFNEDRSSN